MPIKTIRMLILLFIYFKLMVKVPIIKKTKVTNIIMFYFFEKKYSEMFNPLCFRLGAIGMGIAFFPVLEIEASSSLLCVLRKKLYFFEVLS